MCIVRGGSGGFRGNNGGGYRGRGGYWLVVVSSN